MGEPEAYIRPAHPRRAEEAAVALPPRQVECLFWVQQGKSSRDIGVILGISHRMVERHVFRACQTLGVRTRLQAVIRARSLGLIADPPPPGTPPETPPGTPHGPSHWPPTRS